jgi:hypothetical protein
MTSSAPGTPACAIITGTTHDLTVASDVRMYSTLLPVADVIS